MATQTENDQEKDLTQVDPSRAEVDRILGNVQRDTENAKYQPGRNLKQSYSGSQQSDPSPGTYQPGATKDPSFQVPKEPPQRSGLEQQAYDFGKGAGGLGNTIDKQYNKGLNQFQEGQAAKQATAGGAEGAAASALGAEAQSAVKGGAKADPLQGAAQEVSREVGAPGIVAWLLTLVICVVSLILGFQALLFLGLTMAGALFPLVSLLISPKWTYKGVLAIVSAIFGPEVYKYGQYVDPEDIKLNFFQKLIIVVQIVLMIGIMLIEWFGVTYAFCSYIDVGPRFFSFGVSRVLDGASQSNAPSALRDFCVGLNDVVGGLTSTFSGTTPQVGPISISEYKETISKYTTQFGLPDDCVLQAVITMESRSGDASAIGHDNHAPYSAAEVPNGPKWYINMNAPPLYGLDWNLSSSSPNYSHGIGLTQITIFPPGSRQGLGNTGRTWPAWVNGIPGRYGHDIARVDGIDQNHWYTIPELLNADTDLYLAAAMMKSTISRNPGNLQAAFAAYNGAASYGVRAMAAYNTCRGAN